jgi:hypothetical protein
MEELTFFWEVQNCEILVFYINFQQVFKIYKDAKS